MVDVSGAAGETHPHSWEVRVRFAADSEDKYEQFTEMEKLIKNYLAIYEGRILNEIPPFDVMVPTLENITKVFASHLENIMARNGFVLQELSVAESPSRRVVAAGASAEAPARPAAERRPEPARQESGGGREQERRGKVVRLPLATFLRKDDRGFF